ncbi:MAG: N-acetyl-gamma-glutamyl-phosphate reductase [Oscillospiraceae bacterium]|jgi:N-acetyl-gamma-glutamyl-phosphate reductase|nr:N-acetyl-gamma-glutamyl-phosphate reductase [Oscillospiraceae bacterium]
MYKVYIDGSEGTTGLQIRTRLAEISAVEVITLPDGLRKDNTARREAMESANVTVLCLPDEAALEAVALADSGKTRFLDASTAHRVTDGWTYGLPELSPGQSALIAASGRVSNPGCHATGAIILLNPLIRNGILSPDSNIAITSLTGYTGGGKKMISEYEAANRSGEYSSHRVYALSGNHKHLPEITKYSGLSLTPAIIPVVGDFPQGMQVLIPLFDISRELVYKTLKDWYAPYENISVTDDFPAYAATNALAGSDKLAISVAGSGDRPIVSATFDNLGKGAAGAAVRNLSLMLGIT